MRPRADGMGWMEGEGEDDAVSSWTRNNNQGGETNEDDMNAAPLSTFKSILETTDWYMNNAMMNHSDFQTIPNPHQEFKDLINNNTNFSSNPTLTADNLIFQPIDSSSSCSPSQAFNLDPSSHSQSFLPPTPCFPSLFNNVACNNNNNNNPFENGFDLGFDTNFLANHSFNFPVLMGFNGPTQQIQMGTPQLSSSSEFPATRFLPLSDSNAAAMGGGFGFEGSGDALFLNRSKVLRPLEVLPPVGAQPTLFQKRAALRQGSGSGANNLGNLGLSGLKCSEVPARADGGESARKRKRSEEDEFEEVSIDVSSLNYDSDEVVENSKVDENANNGGNNSNANSSVTVGDQKGKKKGLPAKNLMAERRRRKKLNDRLYMLRSVVPRISKV